MRKIKEVSYHIQVEHEPGTYRSDMDFLNIDDPKGAYEHYLSVKEKYSDKEITITKITLIESKEEIDESQLEKESKSAD